MVLGDWLVALQTELTSLSLEYDVPPAGLTLVDAEPGERSADPLLLSHYVQLPRGLEHLCPACVSQRRLAGSIGCTAKSLCR